MSEATIDHSEPLAAFQNLKSAFEQSSLRQSDKCTTCEMCKDLLSWKSPLMTGSLLVSCISLHILVFLLHYSIISLIAYFFIILLCFSRLTTLDIPMLNQFATHNNIPDSQYEFFSREVLEKRIDKVYNLTNTAACRIRSLLLWHSPQSSIQVLGVLFLAAKIAALLPLSYISACCIFFCFFSSCLISAHNIYLADVVNPAVKDAIATAKKLYSKIPRMIHAKNSQTPTTHPSQIKKNLNQKQ